MQNECSHERTFWCNNYRWHRRVSNGLALALLLVLTGCLPDPQRIQAEQLLDRLVAARVALAETPPRMGASCDDVAEVKSRLMGEPGMKRIQAAWPALRDSADALEAVCGQAQLLAVPAAGTDSAALAAARARWQDGVSRQLALACDNLRAAATGLGREAPC